MAPDGPAVRALSPRDALRLLERFTPGARDIVRAQIPPESLRVLEETPGMGWISIAHDRFVPEVIFRVLGDRQADRFFRTFVVQHMQRSPLLSGLLSSTLKVFKPDPDAFAWGIRRGWSLMFRGFGQPRLEPRLPGYTRLVFENVDPRVLEIEAYRPALESILSGVLEFSGYAGEGHLWADAQARCLNLHYRWRPTDVPRRGPLSG